MLVLLVLAVIAARVALMPMDVRLKRRMVGPLGVPAALIVVYLAWDWMRPKGLSPVYFVGEFAGVCAMFLMAVTLILATRARWLEQWWGGLDRMYLWHKRYALTSVLLLTPHIVLHFFFGFRADAPSAAGYRPPLAIPGAGHFLGAASAIGFLVLITISVAQVGRALRIPYRWWLLVHRFIGLLFVIAVLHGVLLDVVLGESRALFAIYLAVAAAGVVAYIYTETGLRRRDHRRPYRLSSVVRRTSGTLDLTLAPSGLPLLAPRPGQFVYLRVGGPGEWHEHPFSVAGTTSNGAVRLTIRALGRDTQRLYERATVGLPATLSGPHGMFDHTVGGDHQIWIAAGIGIAPFLGWLAVPVSADRRIDLFYCVPDAAEAPFLPDLADASHANPGLHVHVIYSRERGHLSAAQLESLAVPITPNTDIFMCGPAQMLQQLNRDLRRRGVSAHRIHSEHFALR